MSKKHKNNAPGPEVKEEELRQEAAEEEKQEETAEESVTMTAEEFKKAQDHIADLVKQKDEAIALLQRNQADFENFRRRNQTVRSDSLEEGKRECIKALLPVLDNFDRAMDTECQGDQSWREGIVLVQRQLMDTLKKLGLEEIGTDGKFDPNIHEAVMQEEVEGKETGDIIAVFQKGYRVGDKVIRASMVKVAQ